jgi:hypothetical protein
MQRKILQQTHDSYDCDLWADYDALYAGGEKFFARIERFLPQNPYEPATTYRHRLGQAHYRCYLGGIIDYFASFLFAEPLVIRAKEKTKTPGKAPKVAGAAGHYIDPDPFYGAFKEDCDGQDNDLHVFLGGRVRESMKTRCAWWVVEMPAAPTDPNGDPVDAQSRREWKDQGLDRATVRALDTAQVLDWEVDDKGQLLWAIVLTVKTVRPKPTDTRTNVVETYEIFDRDNVSTFELVYPKNKRPTKDVDVPAKGAPRPHGFKRVPLVCLDVGENLWIANRVASPQTEHCRISNGLGWAIRRTCYVMPVLSLDDPDGTKIPTMGTGYAVKLGKGDSLDWAAPPTDGFETIRNEIKDNKDEIFRIVHQMALGVDNNAAAVGRSGKSKEADAAAVRVILGGFGKVVREAVERTYSLLSEGRGEGDRYDWSIEGLDSFIQIDLSELLAAAQGVSLLDIRSPTFHRAWQKRVAIACLPDADQREKDEIVAEIEKNLTDESVLSPPTLEIEPDGDEAEPGPGDGDGDEPPPASRRDALAPRGRDAREST